MEEEGFESVYVLDDKETYGKGLADQFELAAEEAGIEVLGRDGIDGKAPNYRSLMQKIADADPDAIYFGGITQNNGGQLVKDKVGVGMSNEDVIFLGPDGIYEEDFITAAGDAGNGVFATFGGLPEEELPEKGQKFVEDYRAKYGEDAAIEAYTSYGYEAANVMLDAIERAGEDGEVEREEVVDELFATKDYDGILGTWSFDEDGDTTLSDYSVFGIDGGEWVFEESVQAEPVE
jgi:branched-chain amino acid transport system substrate-binding protein